MWHSISVFNLNTGGQPGQCSEFQDIQDYIKRPCMRKQTKLFLYVGINIKFSGLGILRCTPLASPHQCLQRGQPLHLPGGSHKDTGGKLHSLCIFREQDPDYDRTVTLLQSGAFSAAQGNLALFLKLSHL